MLSEHHPFGKGTSLWLFTRSNNFRKICHYICQHPFFDISIIVIILASSITLAFESPLIDPQSNIMRTLKIVDMTCTIIFTIEALLKIVSFGFLLNGKKSYFKQSWNILDFFIVILSLVDLVYSGSGSVFKVIRMLRIFRPIRIIARNYSLKLAMTALINSMP
jgi:membrane-anchored protein YejM (alkaline phosphatase superfamily)